MFALPNVLPPPRNYFVSIFTRPTRFVRFVWLLLEMTDLYFGVISCEIGSKELWDSLLARISFQLREFPFVETLPIDHFSGLLLQEKGEGGCNGAWWGITNWMTTPIWSHSLHRPLSNGGGGPSPILKVSLPPSLIWLNTLFAQGKCTKS